MIKGALPYPKWYRRRGIWNLTHLKKPNIFDYEKIILPTRCIYHWVDYNNIYDVAPDFNETIIKNSAEKLFVEVEKDYASNDLGGYITLTKPVDTLLGKYFKQNPKIFRPMKPIYQYNEVGYLPVYSYGFIDNTHVYKKTRTTEMKRWYNYYITVFEKALKVSLNTDKQQFIEMRLPSRFPTRTNLLKCEEGLTEDLLPYVNHQDMWLVIEFWNLFSGRLETTKLFKNYKLEHFKPINIIWRFDNKYVCMNLGTMMEFAHGETASIKPFDLQRYFLKLMINLNAVKDIAGIKEENTVDDTDSLTTSTTMSKLYGFINDNGNTNSEEDNEAVTGVVEDDEDEIETEVTDSTARTGLSEPEYEQALSNLKQHEDVDTELSTTNTDNDSKSSTNFSSNANGKYGKSESKVDKAKSKEEDESAYMDDDNSIFVDNDLEEDEKIEKILDVIGEDTSIVEEDIIYKEYQPKETTAQSVVEEETLKLVKAGVMSVGSRERLIDMVKHSYEMQSPINEKETIAESLVIKQEDLVIEDKNKLAVESLDIIDESMKYSSLPKYSENYITKVMDKDILSMVMNIQKGGLIIKNYETEEVETVNDHYTIHKVQVETLKGHTSTLSFRLPVVKKDGTFISSGSKRFFRKQRGDKNRIPMR